MTDFTVFWSTYPADLCNRKGSRKKAEIIWDKLTTEIQDQILVNMRELMRVDRKCRKAGEFVPRWPMVTTWLNGERWEDITDIKQSHEMPATEKTKCNCGAFAEVRGGECFNCFYKRTGLKKENDSFLNGHLIKIGFGRREGETRAEWNKRCREHATSGLGRLLSGGKKADRVNR